MLRRDHPSNSKRGGVYIFYKETLDARIVKSLSFNECIICEVSIQNSKGYVGVVYRSPSQNIFKFEIFLSKSGKVLSDTTWCNSLFSIILVDFNARSSVWWTRDKTTIEGTQLESLTSMYGFHQLISQPTHLLPQTFSCIDLIFTDQPKLIVDSGVHPSLQSNCHHQITYCKINLNIEYPPPLSVWFGTTIEQMLKALKNQLSLLIGKWCSIIKVFTNKYLFSMRYLWIYFQTLLQINLSHLMTGIPIGWMIL